LIKKKNISWDIGVDKIKETGEKEYLFNSPP
jgi:hypothetical protein